MTNVKFRVNGLYAGSFKWSYGFNATIATDIASAATSFNSATSAFWSVATDGYKNYCFTDVATTGITVASQNASWRQTAIVAQTLSVTGTGATASLPYNTCVNVRTFGLSSSRSDDGLIKLPAPAIAAISAHVWSAALLASQQIIWTTFWGSMNAITGFQLVSYNRHTNKLGDPPFTNHVLGDSEVSNKPGSARMRTRKVPHTYSAAITT